VSANAQTKTLPAATLPVGLKVWCDKCGAALNAIRDNTLGREVMEHGNYRCERDGQRFECPVLELKRIR
jgi:hypothetical protein